MQRVPAPSSVHLSLVSALARTFAGKTPPAVRRQVLQESDRDKRMTNQLGALRTGDFGALRPRAVSGAAVTIECSQGCDGPFVIAGAKKWRR